MNASSVKWRDRKEKQKISNRKENANKMLRKCRCSRFDGFVKLHIILLTEYRRLNTKIEGKFRTKFLTNETVCRKKTVFVEGKY